MTDPARLGQIEFKPHTCHGKSYPNSANVALQLSAQSFEGSGGKGGWCDGATVANGAF